MEDRRGDEQRKGLWSGVGMEANVTKTVLMNWYFLSGFAPDLFHPSCQSICLSVSSSDFFLPEGIDLADVCKHPHMCVWFVHPSDWVRASAQGRDSGESRVWGPLLKRAGDFEP